MTQRARFAGVAAALALLVLPVQAQGPAQAPARAAPAADPAFEAAKAAFEPLPEPDRKGLQDALVWTGDYNSVITGTFGRRTYDALLSYQKRAGNPAPGFPDARMRAAILAAGEMARKAARFTVKPDSASGVMIGVPERLLAKRIPQSGGTRWQSGDGRVTLDTKSFAPEETSLDALFARITAPGSDRKVTYKIKRPDFLVVTGETATGKSYIRYAAAPGGVRGFTIGYDKALGPDVDRLVIAVANSFVPFPETADAAPAQVAVKPGGTLDRSTPAPAVKALPPLVRAAVTTGIGLVVAPGRVLTSSSVLETCAAPRIAGAAARIVKVDLGRGLALLEGTGAKGRVATLASKGSALTPGDALVVLGADGGGGIAVSSGQAGGDRLSAPLQPGSSGAIVLDRDGALAGLVARYPSSPRLVAGVAPPMSYPMVDGRVAFAFLAENGISPGAASGGSGSTLGAVASRVADSVVGLTCP
ncbi:MULTISPECIES: serine protease [unclassified Methylobacterium]|uniref:serine protease n=1 Tax=unclassified Methylobacterium TaxID=2615210 RepID=UPI00070049F1|nr:MULTISPECIES: serine protease [unclassified Methylobacterium]KQO49504.1 peptidoglycan-binding protein [Methylobacterium sp. Leaf86]KQP00615.1 peptidoglycan-binding protein [Methylobacterium sp. Leaf91]